MVQLSAWWGVDEDDDQISVLDQNIPSRDGTDGDYLNNDDDDANDDDDDDQRWCIIVTERRETRHLALLHCAAAAPSHG